MKKKKRIRRLISSFVCLIGSSMGLATGLSSCVSSSNDGENDSDSDDSVVTPPSSDDSIDGDNNNNNNNGNNGSGNNNGSDSENPSQPETKPEVKPPINNTPDKPSTPENKPEPSPPSSNLISNNSIILKGKGQLLPSQYLANINDLNNLNIDKTKIEENFDNTKVSDAKYTVLLLNDWNGTLSIKMEYKNKNDNKSYEFIFNFTNLCKLNDQNFNLYFDVSNKGLLNAKEISDKSINNNADAKSFFKYLKEKGVNLIFKNGINSLPLEYLYFSNGLTFDGFKNTWYTSNNDIELSVNPKLLKINIYEKSANTNNISVRQNNYPIHLNGGLRNPIKLTCLSALDYLLEQITVNKEYKENKFASYYYYDVIYNRSINTQLQISNNKWLKNIKHNIDGYNLKQYKAVVSRQVSPSVDSEGNLTIQIEMQLSDENVFSRKSKELIIKSFLPMNKNLFYYNGDNREDKFNLICSPTNQDIIFNYIKDRKNVLDINNEIKSNQQQVVDLSKYFNAQDHINFKKYIELYFGYEAVIKDESSEYYNSIDKKISIEHYSIYFDNKIQYDKTNQCFQTKCTVSIQCEGIEYDSSTSETMTVNITKINKPLL